MGVRVGRSRAGRLLTAALLTTAGVATAVNVTVASGPASGSDGTPDAGFGVNGEYLLTSHSGFSSQFMSVALVDGKILAVGQNQLGATNLGGNPEVLLARFTDAGQLDTTFDSDGVMTFDPGGGNVDSAQGIHVDGDGNIFLALASYLPYTLSVAKVLPSGSLDTSFGGGDGITTVDHPTLGLEVARSVIVLSDGSLILAGQAAGGAAAPCWGSTIHFALTKLDASGQIDTSFGTTNPTDGFAAVRPWSSLGGSGDCTRADAKLETLAVQPGAQAQDPVRILAVGDGILAAFTPDGSLDTSFGGGDGWIALVGTEVRDVVVDSNRRILTVGTDGSNLVVERFNADGAADTSFDTDGARTIDVTASGEVLWGISINSTGEITAAGYSDSKPVVVRLESDGTPDQDFGPSGNGVALYSDDPGLVHDVEVDSTGRIVTVGYELDGSTRTPVVRRYSVALSNDSTLSGMAVGGATLDSAFSPSTTSYSASVDYTVTDVTVTPTVNDNTASVTVNGSAVTSGAASNPITLVDGANTINVVVTAQDSSTTTYSITVTKAARPVMAAPTGLSATGGDGSATISFTAGDSFGRTITNYEYSLDSGSTWTALSPADSASPITINSDANSQPLANGTSYTVILRAVTASEQGTPSGPVTVTPAAASSSTDGSTGSGGSGTSTGSDSSDSGTSTGSGSGTTTDSGASTSSGDSSSSGDDTSSSSSATASGDLTAPAAGSTSSVVSEEETAALTTEPGDTVVLVDGTEVTSTVQRVSGDAATTAPEQRTAEQVAAIQTAAKDLVDTFNATAGSGSTIAVENTATGAVITGLFTEPVPAEQVVIITAGQVTMMMVSADDAGDPIDPSSSGSSVLRSKGSIAVAAAGLPANATGEIVLLPARTVIAGFTTDADGTLNGRITLPESLPAGEHTMVIAAGTTRIGLGITAEPSGAVLPATGGSHPIGLALLLLGAGVFLTALLPRRQESLAQRVPGA